MKLVKLALIVILLLLVRKLLWCLRWLWCYYHGREVPEPISFIPQQSGSVFARHVQSAEHNKEESS